MLKRQQNDPVPVLIGPLIALAKAFVGTEDYKAILPGIREAKVKDGLVDNKKVLV